MQQSTPGRTILDHLPVPLSEEIRPFKDLPRKHLLCYEMRASRAFLPDMALGCFRQRQCGQCRSSRDNGGAVMEKKVLNAMKKAGKPVRPGDVAKMLGEDSKQISKVINDLKKQGKVVSPKRCFYEPA